MKIIERLAALTKPLILISGLVMLAMLGLIDYVTGPDLSFIVFYLVPILLVGWFVGSGAGVLMSVAGGMAWFFADILSRSTSYAHPVIPYWNVTVKVAFFLVVNTLVLQLKKSLEREKELARSDRLTGVTNVRFYAELAAREIDRASRYHHPFTVAYMDVDNFKAINDKLGHSAGDALLSLVADTIARGIRTTDMVARIGGDEFSLLLPETGEEPAALVIRKVHKRLTATMREQGWPVTFSIGVVTFLTPPESVDEMLRTAGSMMYFVKGTGKNMVKHKVVSTP
jgi:diguanylate cyclase (GGDEF)-like protein